MCLMINDDRILFIKKGCYMEVLDAFVQVIKSEIRFVKVAISDKHDDGYDYDVMPEHNFHNLVRDIRSDYDDDSDNEEGVVITATDFE